MNNKKLFEEAIAEAKSIREAAIANAKEALEESLTPQIKSLLAQRLTEMEEEDSKELDEVEEEEEVKDEESEESGEEKEEAGEESEEDADIEDMSVEELKDLIRDIVGQMVDKDGDGDHDMDDHDLEGSEMGMEEPAGDDDQEEEIDLDELLAELSEGDDIEKFFDKVEAEFNAQGLQGAELDAAHKMLEKEGYDMMDSHGNDPTAAANAIMDKIGVQETADMSEALDPQTIEMIAAALGPLVIGGSAFAIDKAMKALKAGKAGKAGQALANQLEKAGSAAGAATKSSQSSGTFENNETQEALEAVKSELYEAKKTVKELTENLRDINILNAKLLYVNRVLKENKNLSDTQIANVIATFDKAETSKEARLVYESFSTTFHKKSNAPVVESKLKGLASKAAGKAPVKTEVINEVSDAVKRMQKLAGIIKG